jgi:hypothetical protein
MENKADAPEDQSPLFTPSTSIKKSKLIAFVTLGYVPNSDPQKMQIRQMMVTKDEDEEGECDSEKDVLRYLENLTSICFPSGFTLRTVQYKLQQ